jgi:3alpha(or 20beta)-hydroxysteroid dehydrogenase
MMLMAPPQRDVVLVTGGASGIGFAVCELLAEHGFVPVIADVHADQGEAAADRLGTRFVHLDVSDQASWTAALDALLAAYGDVYGLVSCAAVKPEYLLHHQPDPQRFLRAVAVNQLGATLGIQIVGARLKENGRGSIVNIASAAAMPPTLSPDAAYVATKWAVRGITRSAARELAPHGVRVNTILPGLIQTPMVQRIFAEFPEREDAVLRSIPMGRMGQPVDIARAVYFFMSELGSYATGAELTVDGGSVA